MSFWLRVWFIRALELNTLYQMFRASWSQCITSVVYGLMTALVFRSTCGGSSYFFNKSWYPCSSLYTKIEPPILASIKWKAPSSTYFPFSQLWFLFLKKSERRKFWWWLSYFRTLSTHFQMQFSSPSCPMSRKYLAAFPYVLTEVPFVAVFSTYMEIQILSHWGCVKGWGKKGNCAP